MIRSLLTKSNFKLLTLNKRIKISNDLRKSYTKKCLNKNPLVNKRKQTNLSKDKEDFLCKKILMIRIVKKK